MNLDGLDWACNINVVVDGNYEVEVKGLCKNSCQECELSEVKDSFYEYHTITVWESSSIFKGTNAENNTDDLVKPYDSISAEEDSASMSEVTSTEDIDAGFQNWLIAEDDEQGAPMKMAKYAKIVKIPLASLMTRGLLSIMQYTANSRLYMIWTGRVI